MTLTWKLWVWQSVALVKKCWHFFIWMDVHRPEVLSRWSTLQLNTFCSKFRVFISPNWESENLMGQPRGWPIESRSSIWFLINIYIYPHTNGEMFRNIVANESCGQGNAISGLAQGQSDVAAKVIRTKSRQKGWIRAISQVQWVGFFPSSVCRPILNDLGREREETCAWVDLYSLDYLVCSHHYIDGIKLQFIFTPKLLRC